MSRRQVSQVWNAAGLKPHRLKTFKISNDPRFAERVQEVVGLYMNPLAGAVVLFVDENKRNGTRSLYAAFDVANGTVTARDGAKEFIDFLRQIDRATPPDVDLHLIVDNSSTHKTADARAWLHEHPRFHMHFAPTHASWLNAVETWFSSLERRALHQGVFTSVNELRDEIHRFIRVHKEEPKPFTWTKDVASIINTHRRWRGEDQ